MTTSTRKYNPTYGEGRRSNMHDYKPHKERYIEAPKQYLPVNIRKIPYTEDPIVITKTPLEPPTKSDKELSLTPIGISSTKSSSANAVIQFLEPYFTKDLSSHLHIETAKLLQNIYTSSTVEEKSDKLQQLFSSLKISKKSYEDAAELLNTLLIDLGSIHTKELEISYSGPLEHLCSCGSRTKIPQWDHKYVHDLNHEAKVSMLVWEWLSRKIRCSCQGILPFHVVPPRHLYLRLTTKSEKVKVDTCFRLGENIYDLTSVVFVSEKNTAVVVSVRGDQPKSFYWLFDNDKVQKLDKVSKEVNEKLYSRSPIKGFKPYLVAYTNRIRSVDIPPSFIHNKLNEMSVSYQPVFPKH